MIEREAIEKLLLMAAEVEWEYTMDYQIAIETAIGALNKQIPMTPYTHVVPYPHKPNETVVQCPSCKRRLRTRRTMAKGDEFCPSCGQHISYEGLEDIG